MRTLLALALLAAPAVALAGAAGDAADACRAYARNELERGGARVEDVVIDRDRDLLLQHYGRAVGRQRVDAVLTGNGAVVYEATPGVELSFVCLLAPKARPVFFHWLPRRNAPALAQCRRSAALRAGPHACLEKLLLVEERELARLYTERLQDARARDAAAGGDSAYRALSESNRAWREYRDAECARRAARGGTHRDAANISLACKVELSRLRGAEMRR